MEIQLIRLQSGEQVISEAALPRTRSDDMVELMNPVALVPTQDGNINFVPWCPLAEKDTPVSVREANVVYYATPNEELVKNYKEIFSPIITPQNAGKIIT